jgi:hypothetical protein
MMISLLCLFALITMITELPITISHAKIQNILYDVVVNHTSSNLISFVLTKAETRRRSLSSVMTTILKRAQGDTYAKSSIPSVWNATQCFLTNWTAAQFAYSTYLMAKQLFQRSRIREAGTEMIRFF